MNKLTKLFAITSILFAGSVFAANTTNSYQVIVKQLDLCTDWACTTPFNMFTGSQNATVSTTGVAAGSDIEGITIPTSGSNYGYLRQKISTTFILNAYGSATVPADSAVGTPGSTVHCAANSTSQYSTNALAADAAENESIVMPVSGMFSSGNGVDAAGKIFYGSRSDQTSLTGYTAKSGDNTSTENAYTMVLKQDTLGDDTFYITTVMKGGFDYGLGKPPTTLNFGITISSGGGSGSMICGTSVISSGMCASGTSGNCMIYPDEPVFDFTIK